MDQKELIHALEHNEIFTDEVKSILLELDNTSSMSTQAYLNDLLLMIRDRLLVNEHIIDESTLEPLNIASFDAWIRKEFSSYSSNMYFHSIQS